ncbi:SemiSWEET transporter [Candidatus Woesearchaeota archaeon]|nr:SemiSWEET transporter [Candidatus Woesearchaeota archaeon]
MEFVYLGLIAGLLTTAAFIPQVWKSWKTKSTKDLSLSMTIIFFVGVVLWLIYGITVKDLPMTLWNSITLLLVGVLLILKLKYK